MEALAAIGLASNILQFIDVGYKVLSTAKEMHGTGNGASRANKDIEFITHELKRLSTNLTRSVPTSKATEDERALSRLTEECQKWSDETLGLLEYLKNRNPGSRFEAMKAAVRNHRKRDEKERLVKGLDSCQRQLDLQLTSMSRSEILDKIRGLSDSASLTASDLRDLRQDVSMLRKSLQESVIYFSSKSIEGLWQLLAASTQMMMNHKQERFLRGLRFEGMGNRYHGVENAHETTFEWLLESHDHDGPSHSVLRNDTFKLEAREKFIHWLQHGNGIFHISGKPGAGKSTLMKFICKSESSRSRLEAWANGKALVFAKTFFWRLGNDRQKSLNGLLCTLLHDILTAAPDLIPVAFPGHWEVINSSTNLALNISPDEIESAFDQLLTSETTFQRYRIVFFIDGLDEYDGRHTELVKKFFSWTSSNPDNLKMCVASREWNEFTIGFADCPNLRIHQCTRDDISAFVSHRLKTYGEGLNLVNQDGLDFLIRKITSKAEGVFLWVRLALNATEDGILNGDSIPDLEIKINSFPNELEGLYQHLFDSIHVSDRRKVYETFRMASHMRYVSGLRLLLFWFLNDAIAIPNFGNSMPITEASNENLSQILSMTRRQIYGRCKGFLEVCPLTPPFDMFKRPIEKLRDLKTFTPLPNDGTVSFMHSTAFEFLNRGHIKQAINHIVGPLNVFSRICQTFLASIKFTNESWYFHHHVEWGESQFNLELNRIFFFFAQFDRHNTQFLTFLRQLETVATVRLSPRSTYKYLIRNMEDTDGRLWSMYAVDRYVDTSPKTYVQSLAASHLIYEFLREKDMTYLESISNGSNTTINNLAQIFFSIRPMGYGSNVKDYNRFCDMLELCISRGISPNFISHLGGLTFFDYTLLVSILSLPFSSYDENTKIGDRRLYPVRFLRLSLRYGAVSQLRLRLGPIYQHKSSNEVLVGLQLETGPTHEGDSKSHLLKFRYCTSITSPIALFAKKKGWVITIRDLVELWAPDDYDILQSLLDRNSNGDGTTGLDRLQTAIPSLSEGKSRESWKAVELREDIYRWKKWDENDFGDFEKGCEKISNTT